MPHTKYRDELIEEVAQRLLQCRPGEHFWVWGNNVEGPVNGHIPWTCQICGVLEADWDIQQLKRIMDNAKSQTTD